MNTISAKIVCDSVNSHGDRLTTIQVRLPKYLLQEIARHRVFSLSFNSARAIPAKVLRQSANYKPKYWCKNQPGMSGGSELTGLRLILVKVVWGILTANTKVGHFLLQSLGLHKQFTNRWLEPIVYVDGVITSTEWSNFIELRCHPAAQPEMQELASIIWGLLVTNKPQLLKEGGWHLPYIDEEDRSIYPLEKLRLISAGRCARVSYGFQDKKNSKGDLARAKLLKESSHWSPYEHIGLSVNNSCQSGNFKNWGQYRKILLG